MTPELAKRFLEDALARLLREDLTPNFPEGFPDTIGERPLVFRLAHYLIADGVEKHGLHVDCDYNRHGLVFKELRPKAEPDMPSDIPEEMKPRRFFPDIVVHRRGDDTQNTLVCEIKRVGDRRSPLVDQERLRVLTRRPGTFEYRLGAFVQIDQALPEITIQYFVDGQPNSSKVIDASVEPPRSIKR